MLFVGALAGRGPGVSMETPVLLSLYGSPAVKLRKPALTRPSLEVTVKTSVPQVLQNRPLPEGPLAWAGSKIEATPTFGQ